jgi:hypothetical protein
VDDDAGALGVDAGLDVEGGDEAVADDELGEHARRLRTAVSSASPV